MSAPIDIVIKRTASNGVMRRLSKHVDSRNPQLKVSQSLVDKFFSLDKTVLQPLVPPVAGFLATFLEISILFPTEYCKTQLQLNRSNASFSIIRHLKERRLRIYQALPPMLIGAPLQGLLRFSCLDAVQKTSLLTSINSPAVSGLLAGVAAGTIESVLVVTPMETVKTKLIDSKKSLSEGVRFVVRTQGLAGLYNGLGPTIAKSASNQAIRFIAYNQYKQFILKESEVGVVTPLQAMTGGILAGLVGCVLNTPIDTVKSRMQGMNKENYKHGLDCVRKMVTEEGASSLYKGFLMRSARVVPGQGIIFLVYEYASVALNDLLTA